ncbi:unnamed protein product [Prunus armeniaca]
MQALPISGGEQCIGFAINGSEFEKPENNPAITCSFPVEKLDLNYFTGPLPAFIGNMSALTVNCPQFILWAHPQGAWNLKELTMLSFGSNNFSRTLPPELGNLVNLGLLDLSYNYFSGSFPRWVTTISQLLPGLNCLPRNFPCHRSTPRYANFSIKCGGPQMRGNDGILYKAEDSALGPATFNVTSTQKWAVSNAGYSDNLNQSFVETTLTQVSGADLTPELYKTSRVSPGSLRYYDLGLQNGPYTVSLQFAETVFASRDTQTSQSPGRRVFDIDILGYLRRKDFDISKQAGGVNRAVPRPFKVNVTENYPDIHLFWAGKGICCIPEQDLTPTTPGKKSRTGLIVGIAVPVGFYICGEKHQKKMTMKGTLSDGRVVAVKQLSVASHQGKSQFVTEIAMISAVQHRNLVKLYGCCIEGSHRILEEMTCTFTARPASIYCWEQPEDLLTFMRSQRPELYIEMSKQLYDNEKTHMSTRVAGTM